MKKVLALALAMVLTAGLSSIAFADVQFVSNNDVDSNSKMYVEKDGFVIDPAGEIKKGTTVYIPLKTTAGEKPSDVAKYKVRTEWLVGGDSVTKTSIVYKKVGDGTFAHFVAIETKTEHDTSKQDLVGKMWVYKTNYSKTTPLFIDFSTQGVEPKAYNFGDLDNDTAYVLKFGNAPREDVDVIVFADAAEFEGDFYQQTKLNMTFNTKYNEEIGKAFPEANLEFITFPGAPSFNKWGTMRLFAEDDTMFVYAVEDGKLVKVEAKYDAEHDAYTFGAKKLATFIMSDVELDVTKYVAGAVDEVEAPAETPAPEATKPNPGTGR